MTWDDATPWTAPARSVVLYCPKTQWRFAIFIEADIIDGALDLPATAAPEDAQASLVARVQDDTRLTYLMKWTLDKPRWWSAELTILG